MTVSIQDGRFLPWAGAGGTREGDTEGQAKPWAPSQGGSLVSLLVGLGGAHNCSWEQD